LTGAEIVRVDLVVFHGEFLVCTEKDGMGVFQALWSW